jgi:hypothetical protein
MKNQESTNTIRLSKKLLKEMISNVEKEETLDTLIELLETTNDPDPSELYLLESLYHLKEKIKLVESRINANLIKSNKFLSGNKLNDLYESSKSVGSSIFFDY